MGPTQRMQRLLSTIEGNYGKIIEEAHKRYPNVSHKMIVNMIGLESGGRKNVTSSAGAGGLMQLMPGTAKELGVTNRFDPAQNIEAGAHYMSNLLKRYDGDVNKALSAYNTGPGRVDKGIYPRETRNYVSKYNTMDTM